MGVENDLYYKPWMLFYIIQAIGLLLFALGLYYKIRIYRLGGRKSLYQQPQIGEMIKAFFLEVVGQRQLLKKSFWRWLMHMMIFYGFLGLISLSALAVLLKLFPESSSF